VIYSPLADPVFIVGAIVTLGIAFLAGTAVASRFQRHAGAVVALVGAAGLCWLHRAAASAAAPGPVRTATLAELVLAATASVVGAAVGRGHFSSSV